MYYPLLLASIFTHMTSPIHITPITHASAVIEWNGTVLYTDPTGDASAYAAQPAANIILVTDIHSDHLSSTTLAATLTDATLIVPRAVYDELPHELASHAHILANGESTEVVGFQITAVPMYNMPESPDSRHPKGRGNGYLVEKESVRLYIAGDTAGTPEMRALTDIDTALIPMNVPYTMGVEEAASAVLDFAPKHVYPYHYRGQDGLADINHFKELVHAENQNIDVVLLHWYP